MFCTTAPAIFATALATTKNGIWYAACLRVALHNLSLSHTLSLCYSLSAGGLADATISTHYISCYPLPSTTEHS